MVQKNMLKTHMRGFAEIHRRIIDGFENGDADGSGASQIERALKHLQPVVEEGQSLPPVATDEDSEASGSTAGGDGRGKGGGGGAGVGAGAGAGDDDNAENGASSSSSSEAGVKRQRVV